MMRHRLVARSVVACALGLAAVGALPAAPALPAAAASGNQILAAASLPAVPSPDMEATLMLGQGTGNREGSPAPNLQLFSYSDFEAQVTAASPSLSAAVLAFFEEGGGQIDLQLTSDESAATLVRALGSSVFADEYRLVSIPSLGELSGADYRSVAVAADQRADQAFGIALLDPPSTVVQQAGAGGDSSPLITFAANLTKALPFPSSASLLSSGLLDSDGTPVAGSAVLAGMEVSNDVQNGIWTAAGGTSQPAIGFTPVWSVPNAQEGSFIVVGINAWKTIPGYGTILWGDFTLAQVLAGRGPHYLSAKRLLDMITLQAYADMAPCVFLPDDIQTWNEVSETLQEYLYGLWKAHILPAPGPAQPFQVTVGLGSTMTQADIDKGLMIVSVDVAPGLPADWFTLTLVQKVLVPPLPAAVRPSNGH